MTLIEIMIILGPLIFGLIGAPMGEMGFAKGFAVGVLVLWTVPCILGKRYAFPSCHCGGSLVGGVDTFCCDACDRRYQMDSDATVLRDDTGAVFRTRKSGSSVWHDTPAMF